MEVIINRINESTSFNLLRPFQSSAVIKHMIDSENFSSLMTYRDTKEQIKEEQKKRGTYNRAKKNKKKDQPTR